MPWLNILHIFSHVIVCSFIQFYQKTHFRQQSPSLSLKNQKYFWIQKWNPEKLRTNADFLVLPWVLVMMATTDLCVLSVWAAARRWRSSTAARSCRLRPGCCWTENYWYDFTALCSSLFFDVFCFVSLLCRSRLTFQPSCCLCSGCFWRCAPFKEMYLHNNRPLCRSSSAWRRLGLESISLSVCLFSDVYSAFPLLTD